MSTDAEKIGWFIRVWRRQAGKTTSNAFEAIDVMARNPGILIPYASASIAVGQEMLLREAEVWHKLIAGLEQSIANKKGKLDSNIDGLSFDDFCEMFQAGKVEIRLHHDRTTVSRTKLVAPNPATARGYTGYVIIDEVGHIRDFDGLWDAMEAIASRDPAFRVRMSGTPPREDDHPFWQLTAPPEGLDFDNPNPNERGHWYRSMAGVWVHRVDAWDADSAGIKLYDLETRKPLSPDDHRARAVDKQGWDRNYALRHIRGGAAAYSFTMLSDAQKLAPDAGLAAIDEPPENWSAKLSNHPVAIGLDPATTTNKHSNPTGFAVCQRVSGILHTRLAMRWKKDDPADADETILAVVRACAPRAVTVVIDGSNERYYARALKAKLRGLARVVIIAATENLTYRGETMQAKPLTTNLLLEAFRDGCVSLPSARWLRDDFRLVKHHAGSFVSDVDKEGNHADVQDAVRFANYATLNIGGPVQAAAVSTASSGQAKPTRPGIVGPIRNRKTFSGIQA